MLSQADRARIVAGTRAGQAVVLVDGFASATWSVSGGELVIAGAPPREDVDNEGRALLELLAPGVGGHHVTFA